VLVAVSSWRTTALAGSGAAPLEALNGGFQLAFGIGAGFALVAAVAGGALLRPRPMVAPGAEADVVEVPAAAH
jgi:hypothetical protein